MHYFSLAQTSSTFVSFFAEGRLDLSLYMAIGESPDTFTSHSKATLIFLFVKIGKLFIVADFRFLLSIWKQ